MKKLPGLAAQWIAEDNLQLGCLRGCLDFLGMDVSTPWLAGSTGHAFIISITRGVCLSSPWNSLAPYYRDGTMTKLGRNVGFELECHVSGDEDASLPTRRAEAWDSLRSAIDAGHPCYGYHNFCYQVISGYDDQGFYVGDGCPNAGQGPFPFLTQDGYEVCIVKPGHPAKDRETVKDALEFSLEHAEFGGRGGGTYGPDADSAHGLAAYDRWIEAMEAGEPGGTWRAGRAWYGCRSLAVEFLDEAKLRMGGGLSALLQEAQEHCRKVREYLKPVAEAYVEGREVVPIPPATSAEDTPAAAAEKLRAARAAEADALASLERIVAAL